MKFEITDVLYFHFVAAELYDFDDEKVSRHFIFAQYEPCFLHQPCCLYHVFFNQPLDVLFFLNCRMKTNLILKKL